MSNDVRRPQLIPMVQAVLDTLQESIELEEAAATEIAKVASFALTSENALTTAILSTGRSHAVRALELRGKRAALLAEYGLEPG